MEHTRKQYTISVYTENNIGLLNRISAIFQRRHINIESMNISVSEIEAVSRFTILVNMTEVNVRKIIGQIEKQIEVIKAFYHTDEETIYLESCMFKIKSELLFEERQIQNIIKESLVEIQKANQIQREKAPLSKLTIGLECGGSDGFSGISANPTLGA